MAVFLPRGTSRPGAFAGCLNNPPDSPGGPFFIPSTALWRAQAQVSFRLRLYLQSVGFPPMAFTLKSACPHRPRRAACPAGRRAVASVAAGWLVVVALLVGCQRRDSGSQERDADSAAANAAESEDGHAHAHGNGHGHGHAHGHDGESPSGASFKAGRGVRLTDETRKLMGVEVADVTERAVQNWTGFMLQVFDERHQHAPEDQGEHPGCTMYGAGFIPLQAATNVVAGQRVETMEGTNVIYGGAVLTVRKSPALGEFEVVVGISNAVDRLKIGDFIPARARPPGAGPVPAVPRSAVLRTSEGEFVYAVNGDSYLRTPVQTGAESDGWVEIVDGLLSGDAVATQPVEALYLIELRATKGGGHSH